MIQEEAKKILKLHPQHHHFELVPDPWDYRILGQIYPNVRQAFIEHRVQQGVGDAALHGGIDVMPVWFSISEHGALLQEWGLEEPSAIARMFKCPLIGA
jgi:hypothetical protein